MGKRTDEIEGGTGSRRHLTKDRPRFVVHALHVFSRTPLFTPFRTRINEFHGVRRIEFLRVRRFEFIRVRRFEFLRARTKSLTSTPMTSLPAY